MNLLVPTLVCLLSAIGNCDADRSINPMLRAYRSELISLKLSPVKRDNSDVSKKVNFHLYTRKNNVKQDLFPNNLKSLQTSSYDRRLPTKIVTHGFLANPNKPMSQSIKNNFLATENVNVILVDWSKVAISLNYNEVSRSTRYVGAYLATLIDALVAYGTQPKDIHLIGHSLGAHVSGFAGAAVKRGRIGRITGLDPAKPNFEKAPPSDRLDPSDAQFVDCIHTCGGMLGLYEPICTVDFYPNGGKHVQPGCTLVDFGRCSHQRSYIYFAESIFPSNKFPAANCPSVTSVKRKAECKPSNIQMGYHTSWTARGIFRTETGSKAPFCILKK